MNTQLLFQLSQLSIAEQLELIDVLWDGIAMHHALPSPTAAQRAELDRRLADHEENLGDVVAWSEVKAAALARIKQ